MSEQLKEITDDNFKEEVIENDGVVLVDFYAQWCAPCKILAQTVEEFSGEFYGKAKICKADVEVNSTAVKDLGIAGVPFVAMFKDGKMLNKHIGHRSKKDLKKDLDEACSQLPSP